MSKTKQHIQDRKNGNDINENQSCQYLLANGKRKFMSPMPEVFHQKLGDER